MGGRTLEAAVAAAIVRGIAEAWRRVEAVTFTPILELLLPQFGLFTPREEAVLHAVISIDGFLAGGTAYCNFRCSRT